MTRRWKPKHLKVPEALKSANHQRSQQEATNKNTQDKEELTNSGATVKYKYSHIWTRNESFSRLTPPTSRWLRLSRYGSLSASNDQEKLACLG